MSDYIQVIRLIDDQAVEIKRLRVAGNAAFYAMCAYRDSPDAEIFQDAIDALGIALNDEPTPGRKAG